MTNDLRALLTPAATPAEVRPVPNGRGGWDIAIVVDGGYGRDDADDMAGWFAAQLIRYGVRAVAPERTTA